MTRSIPARPSTTVALLAALGACVHLPRAPDIGAAPLRHPPSVLIEDVSVFPADPDGPAVLPHMDVRMADGRISEVVPTGQGLTADQVVSGKGRTVLPGFVDLHVHLALGAVPPWFLTAPDPRHAAESMVYSGVTTVLDLGGDASTLARLQREVSGGRWVGPRIRYAGPGLTVKGAYPLDMTREMYGPLAFASINGRHFIAVDAGRDGVAGSTAAMEAEVDRIADAGGSFIKLMAASIPPADPPTPRVSEELMRAATERAHARGLKVAAHIDSADDALTCARVGVDLLAHGVETSLVSPTQIDTLRASGIAFEPTLVNWARFDGLARGEFHPTQSEVLTQPPAALASFSPTLLEAHRSLLEDSSFKPWADALAAHRADRVANTLAMFQSGIPLRVGSDSNGSIGTFPGSFHEELRLLVEAGVPIVEVLIAATSGNASFLDGKDLDGDRHPDVSPGYGQIRAGLAADLVLVEGDPTLDIRRTEAISQVWVGGVPVRSDMLLRCRDCPARPSPD